MKIFYLDVETTGLHPVLNDIFQFGGIIEIDNQVQTTFNWYSKPLNWDTITKEAEAVHGVSKRKMKFFPPSKIAYISLINLLNKFKSNEKFILAGQGIHFDQRFLKAFFEKHNNYNFEDYFIMNRVVDLKKIVKGIISLSNYKLKTIANACSLQYKAHDAYEDIITTRLLIKHFKKIKKLRKKGEAFSLEMKKQGVEKC